MSAFKMVQFIAVAVFLALSAQTLQAAEPTPAQIAVARELIALKGSSNMYDAVVPGIVERTKGLVLQSNPMLDGPLTEVSNKLKDEFRPRTQELHEIVAKLYASKFTEQELKDALAFYKTPLGRKIIVEEPRIIDESVTLADGWIKSVSDQIVTRMKEEMKKKGYDL